MNLDSNENNDFENNKFCEEVYSKSVRAGKRTYFFDVKSTKNGELYITITESIRKNNSTGSAFYEKHKIFLYKEDFEKFTDGLQFVLDYIDERQSFSEVNDSTDDDDDDEFFEYSDVEFEDLSK